MATDNEATRSGKATSSHLFPFTPVETWSKSSTTGPTDGLHLVLTLSARRLRAQAEFVQSLADGAEPAEVFRHQLAFLETLWRDYAQAALQTLDRVGVSFTRES